MTRKEIQNRYYKSHTAELALKARKRWSNPISRVKKQILDKRKYNERKQACLIHYGGNPPKCSCECGCTTNNPLWLTIDHINGGGSAHRRTMRSTDQYWWIVKNRFPIGFRVLCFNCNCGCARAKRALDKSLSIV